MPRLVTSLLNPLKFVDTNPDEVAVYISRHMDDYWHKETLNRWQKGEYKQPWLTDDTIHLQIQTNGGIPTVRVIRCNQSTALSFSMTQKQQNTYEPDYYIYESSTALSSLAAGTYFFLLTVGNRVLISEPIDVQDEHENSLLIEYTNRKFYQNIIFETEFEPNIRVKGLLRMKPPVSKDTMYEDQVLDMVMLQSKPYRLWDFRVIQGVAPWMIDKLNRILGCSDILIDGKTFTKNDGSKWEEVENIGNGALKEYTIELREETKTSNIYDTENDEELNLILNVSSKGFSGVTGNDILTVTNVD